MESLGTYIRKRRQSLNARYSGYSIRAVARRMGIHHSYLSKIERG
ncbi:MAG: helix-turn-helix domain-containing protein, partial [Desulfonatronovibrionaceae bacterium]